MANNIPVFESKKDIEDLSVMLAEWRKNKGKVLGKSDRRALAGQETFKDIFIIKPVSDIPALSGSTPGIGLVDLYTLQDGTLEKVVEFSGKKEVLNLGPIVMKAEMFALAEKDNYGRLVSSPICCDETVKSPVANLFAKQSTSLAFARTTNDYQGRAGGHIDRGFWLGYQGSLPFSEHFNNPPTFSYSKIVAVVGFQKETAGSLRTTLTDNPGFSAVMKFKGPIYSRSKSTSDYNALDPNPTYGPFDNPPLTNPTSIKLLSKDSDLDDITTWDDAIASVDTDIFSQGAVKEFERLSIDDPLEGAYRVNENLDQTLSLDVTSILQTWLDNPNDNVIPRKSSAFEVLLDNPNSQINLFFEPTFSAPNWNYDPTDNVGLAWKWQHTLRIFPEQTLLPTGAAPEIFGAFNPGLGQPVATIEISA